MTEPKSLAERILDDPTARMDAVDAYKASTDEPVFPAAAAPYTELSPLRLMLDDLSSFTGDDVGLKGARLLSDAAIIRYLPSIVDDEINWDGFDDWLYKLDGWALFRDFCLEWEPDWFRAFVETYE